MKKYIPSEIEPKWQKKWAQDEIYKVNHNSTKERKYILVEFTYPSGDLHIGHWFTFLAPDIYARFLRMQGYEIFLPNGFDAFGLPAENAAIKRGINPKEWTLSNIKRMKEQFATMGPSYNWENEVITCLPEYYKWNQWIFLRMLEKGLAYRGKAISNWCPSCQTVLANENVESGKCWRCESEVEQKEIEQWFLKITEYADRLIWDETPSVDWPKPVVEGQNNWIGKSIGVVINFDDLKVFTTRHDTIFGTTFIVISPEYPLLRKFVTPENKENVEKYLALVKNKSELERKEEKEKTGVFTGSYVKNPISGQQTPVWIADYVLMGYGTGAVMGVPAHDVRDYEFATKFALEIKPVVIPLKKGIQQDIDLSIYPKGTSFFEAAREDDRAAEEVYEGEGVLINSGDYTGMTTSQAREKISNYIEEHDMGKNQVNYHLHDWSISRQRYWGTPIPMIHCEKCGLVPVPDSDLPVELPEISDFTPKGKPPLATVDDWVNVKCPTCGGDAKREVETMDTFFDSSWYFFRYLDPHNKKELFDQELIEKWMPLDIYYGGAEHTLGHTLYSRFFTKFFKDLGLINFEEYAKKRVQHGTILGPDGEKMSKSRGNVVNPDDEVKKYGADTVRLYLSFLMPYEATGPWQTDGVWGPYRFLQRVWAMNDRINNVEPSGEDLKIMHKTIRKVTEDIKNIKSNTAIAALMEWLNYLSRKESIAKEEYKTMLLLLAPFAPHITEELWSTLGEEGSIHTHDWPKFEEKYLEEENVLMVVQINGKVRDALVIQKDILNNESEVQKMALESQKVQKFLEGATPKKTIYIPGKVINFVI